MFFSSCTLRNCLAHSLGTTVALEASSVHSPWVWGPHLEPPAPACLPNQHSDWDPGCHLASFQKALLLWATPHISLVASSSLITSVEYLESIITPISLSRPCVLSMKTKQGICFMCDPGTHHSVAKTVCVLMKCSVHPSLVVSTLDHASESPWGLLKTWTPLLQSFWFNRC